MNKKELIDAIYENVDQSVSKQDISTVVSSVFNTIEETVASGEKITLVGFGSFERRDRVERQGRNPRTGEVLIIPAISVPAFSAGKTFKGLVAAE